MDKLHEIAQFVANYGYLAIFILVFLQEIGVPNPVTNEVVLMLGGYLSYAHALNLVKVILVVISADVTGTCILFFVFYYFGNRLISRKPKWFPIKISAIERFKNHVNKRGQWSIFVGRLTPFLRGYISIAAGILQVKPQKFLTTVTLSALTWSGGFVLLGFAIGPYWNIAIHKMNIIENIMLIVLVAAGITITGWQVVKSRSVPKPELPEPDPKPSLEME